jgi:hypothetical protein
MADRSAYLAYTYLLRIPILAWAFLSLLVGLALSDSPMVRGLFDLTPSTGLAGGVLFVRFSLLALTICLASAAMAIASWLILVRGSVRFGAGEVRDHLRLRVILGVLAVLPSLAVLAAAYYITGDSASEYWHPIEAYSGGALGFAVAGGLYALAVWLRGHAKTMLWVSLTLTGIYVVYIVGHALGFYWVLVALIVLALVAYGASRFLKVAQHTAKDAPRNVTTGYFDDGKNLAAEHVFFILMLILSLMVYVLIGRFKFESFGGVAYLPTYPVARYSLADACLLHPGRYDLFLRLLPDSAAAHSGRLYNFLCAITRG